MARSREDLEVPASVRAEVISRDCSKCRICGQWVEHPAVHHIRYRSQGGLHVPENLTTVGWLPGHDCHLKFAHGPEARLFRELLQLAIKNPGTTALQLKRWREKRR